MFKLDDYREFISAETISEIKNLAQKLSGKKIVMVNSTNRGGGVAEILNSLVPLLNQVGVDVEWRVITGDESFFGVTKKMHNALQGEQTEFSDLEKKLYLETNKVFAADNDFSVYDLVVIHDPQPLPLVEFARTSVKQPWIFRLHIDVTDPVVKAWDFVKSYIGKYNEMIISHEDFRKPDLPIPQRVIAPAINALSEKNRDLPDGLINQKLAEHSIALDKPILIQVSRFDKWKDPIGVIRVFEKVKARFDCQLILLGALADDDPEGQEIYDQVQKFLQKSQYKDDVKIILFHDSILTNALQRVSTVAIQKSVREGFGLIISESMFKKTPVVASNVGGIKTQIADGINGFLHEPADIEGFADDILKLLEDKALRDKMGEAGRRHVIEHFLMPRLMLNWLNLFNQYLSNG